MVLSLVRSNAEGDVGFLGEKRRLNGKLAGHSSRTSPPGTWLMRNSGYDETEAFSHGDRGFRNCEKVSPTRFDDPRRSPPPSVQDSLWFTSIMRTSPCMTRRADRPGRCC